MVGACALVGLTPAIANAAITQTYIGSQSCFFTYTILDQTYSSEVDFQIVRWDNPGVSTRLFQLNVNSADFVVRQMQTRKLMRPPAQGDGRCLDAEQRTAPILHSGQIRHQWRRLLLEIRHR